MSIKTVSICRKCSLLLYFMLLLQATQAQKFFSKVDNWLKNNVEALGGRVVLIIYKELKQLVDDAIK